jgi:hypothetical protein
MAPGFLKEAFNWLAHFPLKYETLQAVCKPSAPAAYAAAISPEEWPMTKAG